MSVGKSLYQEERPPGRSLKPLSGKALPKTEAVKQLLRAERDKEEEREARGEIEAIRKERAVLEAQERRDKSKWRKAARGTAKVGLFTLRGVARGYRGLQESARKEREFQKRKKKGVKF